MFLSLYKGGIHRNYMSNSIKLCTEVNETLDTVIEYSGNPQTSDRVSGRRGNRRNGRGFCQQKADTAFRSTQTGRRYLMI